MSDITLIILCAGESSRFEHKAKKQWLRIDNEPLWLYVAKSISLYHSFKRIIIASHKNDLNYMKNFSDDFYFIQGGESRQDSIINCLSLVDTSHVMIHDVARACIPKNVVLDLINNIDNADCIVPALSINDTILYENQCINRSLVKLVQTPQLSKTEILKNALNKSFVFTDESTAIQSYGGTIQYICGSQKSNKLTFGYELREIDCLKKASKNFFTGIGIDIHEFEHGKDMYLGGIKIKSDLGFKAHSDGDVLIHSVIDALLGAAGAGDIGEFFPDDDEKYKNIDSKELLKYIVLFITNIGYEIVNIDVSIIAQKPKILPYKNEIKSEMSKILKIEKQFFNIKATTSEKLGFIGRQEGVAVHSIATLKYYNWDNNERFNY